MSSAAHTRGAAGAAIGSVAVAVRRQKSLVLILAREFASQLSMPMFVADADGNLVFYNEAAERVLGRTFAEAGELPAQEWAEAFEPSTLEGEPMALDEMPAGAAFLERRPVHGTHRDRRSRRRPAHSRGNGVSAPDPARPAQRPGLHLLGGVDVAMRLTIWGCRGSLASPGRQTVRYGGNTSCVELQTGDGVLILDAGTGLRPLGQHFAEPSPRVDLLLTHLHLDHLEGLGFFLPLWQAGDGAAHLGAAVADAEPRGAHRPLPLPAALPDRRVGRAGDGRLPRRARGAVGAGRSQASALRRSRIPGRRSATGSNRAMRRSRTSPITSRDSAQTSPRIEDEWIPGFDLAAGVDLLLHDAQFTDVEYPERVGWGHSSVSGRGHVRVAGGRGAAGAVPPRPLARRRRSRRARGPRAGALERRGRAAAARPGGHAHRRGGVTPSYGTVAVTLSPQPGAWRSRGRRASASARRAPSCRPRPPRRSARARSARAAPAPGRGCGT